MKSLTYLVYIVLYESLCWGGIGYVVFVLGRSGWWFVLAAAMSGCAYTPKVWASLSDPKKDAEALEEGRVKETIHRHHASNQGDKNL